MVDLKGVDTAVERMGQWLITLMPFLPLILHIVWLINFSLQSSLVKNAEHVLQIVLAPNWIQFNPTI